MKRTLSRTRRARCPPEAGRDGGPWACREGGPRACPTAVPRRRVKWARSWGVRGRSGRPGYPEAHAPAIQGHPVRPGVGPTRVPPALGPRPRGPGRRRPGGRRTTASAPETAGTPRPDESPGRPPGPPIGRPADRCLTQGRPLDWHRLLRSGCHSVPSPWPALGSRSRSSTQGFRFQARPR